MPFPSWEAFAAYIQPHQTLEMENASDADCKMLLKNPSEYSSSPKFSYREESH